MLVTIPFCVEKLLVSWKLYRTSDYSGISYYLPAFWNRLAPGLWEGTVTYPVLFILAGMILWNKGRENP